MFFDMKKRYRIELAARDPARIRAKEMIENGSPCWAVQKKTDLDYWQLRQLAHDFGLKLNTRHSSRLAEEEAAA